MPKSRLGVKPVWWLLLALALVPTLQAQNATPLTGDPAPRWGRASHPYYWSGTSAGAWRRGDASPDWSDFGLGWRKGHHGRSGMQMHWSHRSGYTAARFDYTMFPAGGGTDGLHFARAYLLGLNWPDPVFDLTLLGGVGYLDESTRVNGAMGGHLMLQGTVWPLWPVGLYGHLDLGAYREGVTTLDWALEARVQLWRAISLGVGWRESRLLESAGGLGGFGRNGLTISLNLSFSGLSAGFFGKPPGIGPDPDW